MRRGLVLGKYMPIHQGHLNLIDYALGVCDELIVWVCASNSEKLPGQTRLKWIQEIYKSNPRIIPVLFHYSEEDLPNTSVSDKDVSYVWANAIKANLPEIDIIVTSEKYGDYVAEYLSIEHCYFKCEKQVSATVIRLYPIDYWNYIPDHVKPHYAKKIAIVGTESTGKSTLCKLLANHFQVEFVHEIGRDLVTKSDECSYDDLRIIAKEHAGQILEKEKLLEPLLFIDTDITITKSYAKYLFDKELVVEKWIEEVNQCDLYLYLKNDAPFIQDGTRLSEKERNELDAFHKREFEICGIDYCVISGSWNERLESAIQIIEDFSNPHLRL